MLLVVITFGTASTSTTNDAIRYCMIAYAPDYNKAATCSFEYINAEQQDKRKEIRDFLKHNPRYRVPGQSLNRCWGKPREMPFDSAWINIGKDGMSAGINYKDTIPAGCYENAPWDNRDRVTR